MRSLLAIAAAAAAIWLASPALNSAYVPWGASGASRAFVTAQAIWLISTLAMIVAFRRAKVEDVERFPLALLVAAGLFIVGETIYWVTVDATNNKPMLSRMSGGIRGGFALTAMAVVGAVWPGHVSHSQWRFSHCARWISTVIAGGIVLELALFAVRTVFHRTAGYYAMDCSMFAVAAISVAAMLANLCRCIPLARSADGSRGGA
jgi:hypothetical protein